jgi:hypothetical protein
MYGRMLTVDPRTLAHCRVCYEPMYYIYDQKIRNLCYECTMEHGLQAGVSYEDIIQGTEGLY